MKASSSEAFCGVSSKSVRPCSAASRPTRSLSAPSTVSTWASSPSVTLTPGSSRSSSPSRTESGVRTSTPPREARSVKSATEVSAISCPRPITIRCSAVSAISLIRCEETSTVRPSTASDLSRLRIHRMPSGSRPLTGSSRISVAGSPSSAEAMPRRWPMPSEKPPARFLATWRRPTRSITSSTRERGMPWVAASASRWLKAERPVWIARASSIAPTSRSGAAWSA